MARAHPVILARNISLQWDDHTPKADGRGYIRLPLHCVVHVLHNGTADTGDDGWAYVRASNDTEVPLHLAEFELVLAKLENDNRDSIWDGAAHHHNGKGLEHGGHFAAIATQAAYLRSNGSIELAGAIEAVATAADWTRDRIHEHNPGFDQICKRCSHGAIETSLHRYWTCPANADLP